MRINASPENLAALQRGEMVVLVVEMERQPKWTPPDDSWQPDWLTCPVRSGDPVEVVCGACGGTCGQYDWDVTAPVEVETVIDCVCGTGSVRARARAIKPREMDGRWVWEVEVGK